MNNFMKCLVLIALSCGIMSSNHGNTVYAATSRTQYTMHNKFIPNAFPGKVSSRIFSIPLDPNQLMVVYPSAMKPNIKNMQSLLSKKSRSEIPFRLADDLSEKDLQGKHLIIIGNISNNKWSLALYKRRHAFADADFPGKGGVTIHPSTSPWDKEKNVLVIGVSTDEDLTMGFTTFVELLNEGAKTIETIRHLKTSGNIPSPPESVERLFERTRQNWEFNDAPYGNIPTWGLYYALTGNKKWAEHFRDGMYFLYERAETTGLWCPHCKSDIYFRTWQKFMTWELIGDDPFFTMKDRTVIEEVLWGLSYFARGKPYLDDDYITPKEPQQNHYTYCALSLYHTYRYYTEKYGLTGFDIEAEKVRRVFESQSYSYRPNDDAGGGYQLSTPAHYLYYSLAEGDESFFKSGRLRTYLDLLVATTDNRLSPVGFGDVGRFRPRCSNRELQFFEKAAWYYRDGQYKWLSNWKAQGRKSSFSDLLEGGYTVDINPKKPEGYIGIVPIILDDASLRFSSRRSDKKSQYPLIDKQYFDKLVFRLSFDPQDEYLLIDGTSTFAHGQLDGNTVARLTWKDRIWLYETDYIRATPRYHIGVTVVCDGIQDAPPPLNSLDYAKEFDSFGITRTTSRDFNGADWERNIVWKKGEYFLFLDNITALKNGDFRLENRWRTLGDVDLSDNVLSVHQGDKSFYIKSADTAFRTIGIDAQNGSLNYPYGNGENSVCCARKSMEMDKNSSWTFANLMYAVDGSLHHPKELYKVCDGLYRVEDSKTLELIGLNADLLSTEGVYTDCSIFLKNSSGTLLMDTSYLKFKEVSFESSVKVHFEIDSEKSTGNLIIPEGSKGRIKILNLVFQNPDIKNNLWLDIKPGTYSFTFKSGIWRNKAPFNELATAARTILPEPFNDHIANFGIEPLKEFDAPDSIVTICPDGSKLISGDSNGSVTRYDGSTASVISEISSKRTIVKTYVADVNGDGMNEIIAGDDDENIYCFDASGRQLWKSTIAPYGNAVDITAGDIDNSGRQAILVSSDAKRGKLFAFNPDGTLRWVAYIYNHSTTKVKIFKTGGGKNYIGVGVISSSPLNVVNPVDGKVIWYTWQNMGAEARSVTDYCGIHLTDMVLVDTDNDGGDDIVFGTQFNWVCALDADNGATKWKITVGDAVTVMKVMDDPLIGQKRILVATEAGELYMLDRTGKKLNMITFGSGISDIEILTFPDKKRNDILLSTRDGRIIICDHEFLIRASFMVDNVPLKGIVMGPEVGKAHQFFCASDKKVHFLQYRPYFKRMSRQF